MNRVSIGLVSLSLFAVACAAPEEEGIANGAGAQSADASEGYHFTDAVYSDNSGRLQIVTHEGEVRGSFFTSVGDPANGGATCSFAFSGRIDAAEGGAVDTDAAVITIVDGFETVSGTLYVTDKATGSSAGPTLKLEVESWPAGCSRLYSSSRPLTFKDAKKRETDGAIGFAAVSADKAFFYDAPSRNKRSAYVIGGDVVTLKETNGAVVVEGFAMAEYTNREGRKTSGFLSFDGLSAPWATE